MYAVLAALLLPIVALAAPAPEQYPVRPVRLIVSYPPGGADDAHGRLLAERLTEILGKQVIVDNRPGAAGVIGQDTAAKAAPDGYTLLFAGSTIVIKPLFYPKMPYDLQRDLMPLGQVVSTRFALVVPPASPAKSVGDLISIAKAQPGKLNYASSGTGATPHLCTELFKQMAQVNIVHVPYKGGGPAMTDLVAGQVDMSFATLGSSIGFISTGRLRALGVTSATRSKVLPEVPTIAESGVPGFEITSWYGVLAPSGIPKSLVPRISKAILDAVASPSLQERFAKLGSDPVGTTPAQFTQLLQEDTVRLTRIAKAAGIKTD